MSSFSTKILSRWSLLTQVKLTYMGIKWWFIRKWRNPLSSSKDNYSCLEEKRPLTKAISRKRLNLPQCRSNLVLHVGFWVRKAAKVVVHCCSQRSEWKNRFNSKWQAFWMIKHTECQLITKGKSRQMSLSSLYSSRISWIKTSSERTFKLTEDCTSASVHKEIRIRWQCIAPNIWNHWNNTT